MINRKLVAVAVASAFAGGAAYAQTALSGATATAIYAREISTTSAVPLTNATQYAAPTGWGWSSGTAVFIRYDLTSATFTNDPTLTLANTAGSVIANVTTTKNTGGAGSSSIIFQSTSSNSAETIANANARIALNNLNVTSTAASATLTQCVFDTAANAVANGSTGKLSTCITGTVISFAPSYTVTATSATNTANVSSTPVSYSGFTGGVSATTAALGTLTLANSTSTVLIAAGTLSNLAIVAGATSSITVTGDFTAASSDGVYDAAARARVRFSDATCANGAGTFSANSVTATTAVFPANGTSSTSNTSLCLTAQGNTAIPVGSYTVVYTPVAQTGYTVSATTSAAIGSIVRNGGQLTTPWFTLASGWTSRFILSNNSAVAVTYAVSVKGEAGNTITANASGATGTIPANGLVVIAATDIVTSVSGNSRAAATFTFATNRTNVDGVSQAVNATTGAISSIVMGTPGAM